MSAPSTARTMEYLRKQGYPFVEKVEQKVPQPTGKKIGPRMTFFLSRSRDLFGGLDVLAIDPNIGLVGVQTTDGTSHGKHRTAMLRVPALRAFAEHHPVLLISWSKKKLKPHHKRHRWVPRLEWLKHRDFVEGEDSGS